MEITAKNKIVVITGAAKGIGAAVAALFGKEGATVVILDISPDGAAFAEEAGACFFLCDVSDATQVKNVFQQIEARFGKVDILVNNAGIQTYGKITDMEEEDWDRTIDTNMKGPFLCSKYAIPLMEKSDAPVIINMSSVQALTCEANIAAYVASKAGILGLTKAIAVDYAPRIRCLAVCPGAVNTELTKKDIMRSNDPEGLLNATKNIHLLKRMSEPEEVAAFVLFLSGEQAAFCTGHHYRIDGGIGARIALT